MQTIINCVKCINFFLNDDFRTYHPVFTSVYYNSFVFNITKTNMDMFWANSVFLANLEILIDIDHLTTFNVCSHAICFDIYGLLDSNSCAETLLIKVDFKNNYTFNYVSYSDWKK
jgi:hypothetical protein